jgi:hypothetical protein
VDNQHLGAKPELSGKAGAQRLSALFESSPGIDDADETEFGRKRRLAGYITAIRLNGLHPKLFVEPFAGGVSGALQLLNDGVVELITRGVKAPLLASSWKNEPSEAAES